MVLTTYTQLDVAPTIARILDIRIPDHDGKEIWEAIRYIEGKNIEQILLVIIDGIGVTLYTKLSDTMQYLKKLSHDGLFFECKSLPPRITTPNIGTILTGYTPEHHLLYKVTDVFYTPIKSVLEIASENGIKSGIIVETMGAKSMLNRVDVAIGVENTRGIVDYDRRITGLALKAFKLENVKLMAIHLRAVDNCLHHYAESWEDVRYSATTIDGNIKRLVDSLSKSTLLLITSDHPVHVPKWAYVDNDSINVPLIVYYKHGHKNGGENRDQTVSSKA
jgi:predicted AlkP superfamily pyrophosphatase or phosphodiesterase